MGKKSFKELLEIYPEYVAFVKYFEGIATKDIKDVDMEEL